MGSDALVLGFDTSAAHCAAALLSGDRVLCLRAEEMGRGQAERLMPLLEEVLAEGGARWGDLNRIGTGVGPGNFTGIRISVSAARGLALALDIPAVGVSSFDAIGLEATGAYLPAVAAPREQVYIRPDGEEPKLVPIAEAEKLGLPLALPPAPEELALAIARVAARADVPAPAPAPLYIRPADAAPPREAPPVILDDDT
ncbi:tRNA (adenosine(37)-N6)-threonylcarbamoyltransferase complex dimerization subunit type 1 TsaB [Roseovarius indicus]|uniref:tRNA (adenosine(37)-N6)-threonylcarbamoyltransferase complex dimerization subunit type 1 TsaB n=1 Tax=Roseovarius indicus TaxID=540747 RepID=UPI0032EB624A